MKVLSCLELDIFHWQEFPQWNIWFCKKLSHDKIFICSFSFPGWPPQRAELKFCLRTQEGSCACAHSAAGLHLLDWRHFDSQYWKRQSWHIKIIYMPRLQCRPLARCPITIYPIYSVWCFRHITNKAKLLSSVTEDHKLHLTTIWKRKLYVPVCDLSHLQQFPLCGAAFFD